MLTVDDIESKIGPVLNLYRYGSHVYGTNTPSSDEDFIAIADRDGEIHNQPGMGFDITLYTRESFQNKLGAHAQDIMECVWLPSGMVLKAEVPVDFNLNLQTLRRSVSERSSLAWVKAKKKLIDGDVYTASKSLYHALRIADFGIQIAKDGRILNYQYQPHILQDIQSLDPVWDIWSKVYKPHHNKLMSEFRVLAPIL
jgi:hypothetical protein